MTRTHSCLLILACAAVTAACTTKVQADPGAEAPPEARVEPAPDSSSVKVAHPEQFAIAQAQPYTATPELAVTGVVTPDISRNVPAVSLATGRVIEIHARLGDEVTKGQLLLKVRSTDIASAFSDHRKAAVNEQLTRSQLERARILYEKGALAAKDLEVAQSAENSAKVDVETATERLRLLGADPDNPSGVVDILAPVSGIITDQQVTGGAGVQAFSGTNPFTISDMSRVWILCDVYENNLSAIRLGETADITLNAYPDKVIRGTISNIGAVLDPNLHTAKVRVEVPNPGRMMRVGMFVTATFRGRASEPRAMVPATAILHLHDRDWVYVPAPGGLFRRVPVVGGKTLQGGMQEVLSGLAPGDRLVASALVLQNAVDQQ
ncbi:MAG: efflux RND transporter periplasmic adaptor subunit [Acidobacteria bacterium]|nr:efflux RND transporter periplasmic adaptor subunit [Acidobacteriota bacterium]